MNLDRRVSVINRSRGGVSYKIDSLRVQRIWEKTGDTLMIPIVELKELMVIPGGEKLINQLLLIDDEEARAEVMGYEPEPEYFYTEKEIHYLLYEGSNDEMLDCLDYAPRGVLDIIRKLSIEKTPNTIEKVNAINEKLGIDIISIQKLVEDDNENNTEINSVKKVEHEKRRTTPINIKQEVKKYDVINRK